MGRELGNSVDVHSNVDAVEYEHGWAYGIELPES